MPSGLDALRKGIKVLRQHASNGRRYIDPHALRVLCTAEIIGEAVRDCSFPYHERDQIINDIFANGIITFCILVHKRNEFLMPKFLECDPHNGRDSRLPLDEKTLEWIAGDAANDFFEAQWEFRPIILAKNRYFQLNSNDILPFDEDEHDEENDGSFGTIYTVVMKSCMQKLIETKETTVKVIRKQLRFSKKLDFERERRCLGVLQDLKHENIVELLCSYTYKNEHSLIFKCEDMNLDKFLSLPERYGDFVSDIVFYRALYGLASAIHYIHSCDIGGEDENKTIIGFHHDIRPRNILVRRDTFVLADFGLAKIEERDTSSTSYKGGGGDYIAPECLPKGARIKCAADIWSLGGVMVDVVSYMEGGPKARSDAQDLRESDGPYPSTTNCFFFSRSGVKQAVTDTIRDLQKNPKDKTTRTLLKLSEALLKIKPDSRPDSNVVRDNTAYIALKSLFRCALEAMIRWRTKSQGKAPERIWEDTWKLWAWGEEIGINGVRLMPKVFREALADNDQTARKLETHLVDLVNLLSSQTREPDSSMPKLSRRGTSPYTTYNSEADRINKCIRDLRNALPEGYRDRIANRKKFYLGFIDAKPSRLPTLSDETLQTADSSPSPVIVDTEPFDQDTTQIPLESATPHRDDPHIIGKDILNSNSQNSATRYKAKHENAVDLPKGKGKALISSTPATTSASSYSTNPSTDISSVQIQGVMPTPNALPAFPPPMPSFPPSATHLEEPPPQPGRLAISRPSVHLSYQSGKLRRKQEEQDCYLDGVESSKRESKITCAIKGSNMKLRHEPYGSAYRYPHTEHPFGYVKNQQTVTFFGRQDIYEEAQSRRDKKPIETNRVDYIFDDLEECKNFREVVWGKRLLMCIGAKEILWGYSKVRTVSISLWKERTAPAAVSIGFRANIKFNSGYDWDVVDLQLAEPKLYEMQGHDHLCLRIDRKSAAAYVLWMKENYEKLKITFENKTDCASFKALLLEDSEPATS